MQPSLRLLGITGQPKPATAMGRAAEASWKAFQNACKHPDSVPVSSLSQCASYRGMAKIVSTVIFLVAKVALQAVLLV